ncbi:helix-turn-helix domain-containing protein [Mycolicibacter virginiensis]|uniref:helix-turn-helix domain-containing protein n=1 Tax=Mycolicibacter virginiensis TaxID=1795032 RepID=UPI001F0492EB|nr:helix-turn-helix transcriptional regulator [Mycolicibacter virginiensis]ULP49120.1 helix-turn-helix transcriptional regulator [Mycolicibacter virginiensis]
MTTTRMPAPVPFGALLRHWRTHRRVSQLDLSNEAAISTRHLSFVETGRSQPSRDMVLRIAEHLDVPLRDRNRLLLAAGFAPIYPEHSLTAPEMASARAAIREVLAAHEPYPALAVDRTWNVLDANTAIGVLTQVVSPALLAERPLNALRLTLHPEGMAPHIGNLSQWRAFVLGGLRRSAMARADDEMLALHDELAAFPHDDPGDPPTSTPPGTVYVPLRLRVGETDLSFLAMIATFGTAVDITLSELAIESFLPADAATAAYLGAPRPLPET